MPTSTQKGIAGEFSVLSMLALKGLDANMTLGNTKGVDILASNPESGNMYRVEVKTASYNERVEKMFGTGRVMHWMLGKKAEHLKDDKQFYCFVSIDDNDHFRYFIVPSTVVAKAIHDDHRYWLKLSKSEKGSDIRKFRLAITDDGKFSAEVSTLSEFEDRWDFFS